MKVLTLIGEDHPGLLAEVTTLLEKSGIDILDFSGQTLAGTAVITIQVEPYQRAFRLLSDAGFKVVSGDHLLVRLENHPGELARLSRQLAEARVDLRSLHIVSKGGDACIVALETAEPERARVVLADRLVRDAPAG